MKQFSFIDDSCPSKFPSKAPPHVKPSLCPHSVMRGPCKVLMNVIVYLNEPLDQCYLILTVAIIEFDVSESEVDIHTIYVCMYCM